MAKLQVMLLAFLGFNGLLALPQGGYGSGSSSSSASTGGTGGNLQVDCKRQEVSPGKFKFVCEGVDPSAIALKSQHILWLQGPQGQNQAVDIEIPNYKIHELIQAGFKQGQGDSTKINVLLRKPEQTYDAQVNETVSGGGAPQVQLQYQPVTETKIHFPNQKPYSPLQGPLLEPGNVGGGAGPRQQRQVVVERTFTNQFRRFQ